MPLPGVKPGTFGELFSIASWEIGLGFTESAVLQSMQELAPLSDEVSVRIAYNLALQSKFAGAGVEGLTAIPFGGPAPIPTIAGIEGGYYYEVTCTFLDELTGEPEERLIRVSSDTPLTANEIHARAFDTAVYYHDQTGSESFQNLDLESRRGLETVECRIEAAYQGVG